MSSLNKAIATFQKCICSKTDRLEVHISYKQKKQFQQAANLLGRTLTDFVISSLQETALRVVQEQKITKLTSNDSQIFIQTLLSPPLPNKHLRNAVKEYQNAVLSK